MPSGYRQYPPYYPTAALGNYMASAYQQYQHPHSYIGQHSYSYGYSYSGPYAGINGGLGVQPYYPPQTMMPYSMGYQRGY
ncbi:hypothetical protein BS47DRAFT_978881 [Hydnum rufescens UP504]|uniref:Uncharacterized protein n=1 Tax=Hydnum rufescens UP504 TaxID=1448309 RepID=A0A9P6ADB2_9AGAM|nr:hypothetical protein BS47DRAFT_978881 [Hydnum rufescens UP504]